MNQVSYSVLRKDGAWTVRFGGRYFDRFETEEDAVGAALKWARAAPQRQGILIQVCLESEDGRIAVIQPHAIHG